MANSDKNIKITPSRNKSTYPNIIFTGSSTGTSVITLNVLDDNTISFESNEGQVFSLDNNLSVGTIWGVSDISGIPLLRASAGATIGLAEYSGFVGIGTDIPTYKFQVRGLAAFASTADQHLSFIFDNGQSSGNANLQVRKANSIRFYASGDALYTALKGAATSTYTLTLPVAPPASGTANSVLVSNDTGTMSFVPFISSTASTSSSINIANATANSLHPLTFTPTQSISGSAISSNLTLSFNPSTFILSTSGLSVTSTTNSIDAVTGAMTVTGGVGISKNASIGQTLLFITPSGGNYIGIRAGAASANTTYVLPLAAPSTGAVGSSVLSSDTSGNMNWVAMTSGGSATPGTPVNSIQYNSASSFAGATGFTYESSANLVTISSNSLSGVSAVMLRLRQEGQGGNASPNRYSPAVEMISRVWTGVAANENHHRYKFEVIPNSSIQQSKISFKASIDTGTANYYTGDILSLNLSDGVGIGATDVSFVNYFKTQNTQSADKKYLLPTDYPATGTSVLQSNTSGTLSWAPMVGVGTVLQKSVSIISPVTNDEVTLTSTIEPITIVGLDSVARGAAGVALTYFVNYNSDRSSTIGTTVVLGGTAHTAGLASTTTGYSIVSFTNSSVPADNYVWLRIGSIANTTINEFHLTMHYRKT